MAPFCDCAHGRLLASRAGELPGGTLRPDIHCDACGNTGRCTVVEIEPNPFEVSITFGPTGWDAEHPETLTPQQAEHLLLAAMNIVQRCGVNPWRLLKDLVRGKTARRVGRHVPAQVDGMTRRSDVEVWIAGRR